MFNRSFKIGRRFAAMISSQLGEDIDNAISALQMIVDSGTAGAKTMELLETALRQWGALKKTLSEIQRRS